MSMHTTEEWANNAQKNMSKAQSAQYSAHRQCDKSKRAHDGTVCNNIGMYDTLHQTMTQKVKNSYKLVEKLQKRADSLESSLHKSTASLTGLEKALRDKDVPLQLCVWRLEQREKRPIREQVRDSVETALEEGKATLVETQKRLSDAIKKTKGLISELKVNLQDVRGDLEQKFQALRVDEMCLRSTERSRHAVIDRTPPPASARSGHSHSPNSLKLSRHQVAMQESSKNEVQRQHDAERLNRACCQREENAKQLREENGKLVQRCQVVVTDAELKTERKIQERVQETQSMRRRLEGELRETQGKIDQTKNTMSETRYQIKALNEPIDLTSSCSWWRKQRAAKEHIVDPVSTTLQEHRVVVLSHQQDLLSHHQNEKSHLKELHDRRERLKEDLRDKTSSLHIDLNCLTHEAVRLNGKAATGLSEQKLSKAMKVDRAFVPGAVASSR